MLKKKKKKSYFYWNTLYTKLKMFDKTFNIILQH